MNSDCNGNLPEVRGNKRRRKLPDLNALPNDLTERDASSEDTAFPPAVHAVNCVLRETIDVEAIDDDVLPSSARAFAEAKFNSRRTRGMAAVVDLELEKSTSGPFIIPKTIVDCDLDKNLQRSSYHRDAGTPCPPPPARDPVFCCPICMGAIVEATSTKCGHIFCSKCIKSALAVRAKCPTCRKRVLAKGLIRVFLPVIG